MKFIDIHKHNTQKGQADIVIRNLFPAEVAEIKQNNYYSIGLHPWQIQNSDIESDMEIVSKMVSKDAVIAIGETGLDKSITTDLSIQKKVFSEHINISVNYNKPLIIHCVRAYDELLKIRKDVGYKLPWIVHWFNASPEMGKDLIRKGCFLSFGIALFKEDSKAFRTFLKTPIEYIFFETDDAKISITDIYNKASELKHISIEKLQQQIVTNFYNCFGVKL
jgi:TatD DNase family protein